MKKNNIPTRITLLESELPKYWYNLRADLKEKIPPMISPATKKPLKPTDLFPIFTKSLVAQEFDQTNRLIKIPDDVLQYYKTIRPSPLIRAYNLEKFLGTPAEIYFKFEGNNTSGSHKLNSAIPQVYYAKKDGITSLTTETGAGQ
jgi:tryptophan synthase beta chain